MESPPSRLYDTFGSSRVNNGDIPYNLQVKFQKSIIKRLEKDLSIMTC